MKQSNLKFTNPIVTKFEFLTNPNFKMEDITLNVQNTFGVEISKSVDDNEAIVQLNVCIGSKHFESDIPFYIDMTIGAKFLWDDVYDEKTIQNLLSINAPALLLGYARPMVSYITSSGPFSTYTLPFYNFIDD